MKIIPKTEAEISALEAERKAQWMPWPDGTVCDYQVLSANDSVSKKGNDMIKADIRVFNAEGKQKDITCYFGDWNSDYTIARIVPERYEAGEVNDYDLVGKTGKCKLGIQKGGLKDDGTHYADKNDIKEFLKPATAVKKVIEADLNDEIPF